MKNDLMKNILKGTKNDLSRGYSASYRFPIHPSPNDGEEG